MNWCDYAVIALIGLFAIVGLIKGLIMSVYKVVSFFICIFASIKFYPVLAGILEKTRVYSSIKDSIVKNLLLWSKQVSAFPASSVSGTAGAETMLGTLPLPDIFKKTMMEKLPSPADLIDIQGIANAVGDELTRIVISVLSLIVIYVILRLVLTLVGLVLKGVSKLPLVKQVDKLGGFAFGAIQGFLAIYIVCALLVLFNSNPQFAGIFSNLDSSLFAGYFYENNFIMSLMFPSTGAL